VGFGPKDLVASGSKDPHSAFQVAVRWRGDKKGATPMSTTSRLLPTALSTLDWPPLSWLQPAPSAVRIEETVEGQTYLLRAEAPGIDPAKDVTVVYHDGALRLEIRRIDVREDKTRTEFHYDTYGRTITLPDTVDEESIKASYRDGILEITAKLSRPAGSYRTIPVTMEPAKHAGNGKH
jgi:HSP20 family protein